jgi:signal transduction histidine kinase
MNGEFAGFIGILHDVSDLNAAAEALRSNNKAQSVVNSLLLVALEDVGIEELLGKALDNLLTIPCIGLDPLGAVYLMEGRPRQLVLKAQRNLPERIKALYGRLDAGSGFASEALESGRIKQVEQLFAEAGSSSSGGEECAYCCVPVKSSDELLGLIVLSLSKAENCADYCQDFLGAVANVMAGIIRRKRSENEKNEYQKRLAQAGKFAALGEMAAGIAHEINNPLTIIMGNAQYVNECDKLDEQTRGIISEIDAASQRCKKIISGLLGFSKYKDLKLNDCSFNEVVEGVIKLCEDELRQKGIRVVKDLSGGLPEVMASHSHLEQVFFSIITNAAQAMEKGGSLEIRTKASGDGKCVEACFRDDGHGISPEDLSKIFDPFFTTRSQAAGLGLSIAHGLIKQHGGDIVASSEGPGRGSLFTVRLPLKEF